MVMNHLKFSNSFLIYLWLACCRSLVNIKC